LKNKYINIIKITLSIMMEIPFHISIIIMVSVKNIYHLILKCTKKKSIWK